jgi:hypothetical protein
MVAQVSQYSVQSSRVQFGIVNKEQYEKAGETLVIQKLTALEFGAVSSCHNSGTVLMTGTTPPTDTGISGPDAPGG